MTRYLITRKPEASRARVASFTHDPATFDPTRLGGSGSIVRITHSSVGTTDAMARRGDYLLHPFPGFVSGYDFVGELERVDRSGHARGLTPGQRVAGIMPRMGAHASRAIIPSSLLVAVPSTLASPVAATLPLDAVTARRALHLLAPRARTVFVQGVSGSVGLVAAQLARLDGIDVIGTASATSASVAESVGATVVDYRDPRWPQCVLGLTGTVDGAIDHTGSQRTRTVVAPGGRIVRTAFGGERGRQRAATLVGSVQTVMRRFGHPQEVICSAPLYVASHRAAYRRDLTISLEHAAHGRLTPPTPALFERGDLAAALRAAQSSPAGTKVVLRVES